ncbi:MAG TPA: hypothetical protein VLG38_01465 [Gammaproteobacteria bacterium]|nr:hypothetical protein [Gammaproteobacteria bacterium]
MSNWQEGQYNSDYILHHKSIVGQVKYESKKDPARLEEVCIERHDNGDICLMFTTDPNAINDHRKGGFHARLAYNTLFQDLQRLVARSGLEHITTNLEEVHKLRGHKGQERVLIQALTSLEEYDNTLSEISAKLRHYIAPERASLEDLSDEIQLQKQRLHLLEQVLKDEKGGKSRAARTSRRGSFKQKTMARKRRKTTAARRKRA